MPITAEIRIPDNVIVEDADYFQKVADAAGSLGLEIVDKFQEMLDGLAAYASGREDLVTRVRLWKDFAPLSFRFLRERAEPTRRSDDPQEPDWQPWFHGGVIYSGPLPDDPDYVASGLAPALSVSVGDPGVGWSVHT